MIDYHIHTTHSEDSRMTMDEACARAAALGLKEIAITDHMDIDWPNEGFTFEIPDLDQYVKEVLDHRERYQNQVTIKLGIEMGMQGHTLERSRAMVAQLPFDFVIASLHLVEGIDPYLPQYYEHRDRVQSYTDYYHTLYAMLESYQDFSVLGHMDYLRRYSPYPYEATDQWIGMDIIEAILRLLIDKGKGLEVNTSGYRHLSGQPLPHPAIVKRYREMGGEIITIGSDAHAPEYVGYQNQQAVEIIRDAGFSYLTTFTQLEPRFIKI